MTLTLRYMTLDDIPQVMEIEHSAFTSPWSSRSYAYEATESTHSYMLVVEGEQTLPHPPGWRRWFNRLTGSRTAGNQRQILAYGGLWNILDEAHVSTIAVNKQHRGKSYGELALAAMVRKSIALGAEYIVLEVRVSNIVAQNLYLKYGFKNVGVKRNYYRDDNEDAYDMRLMLDDEYNTTMIPRFDALLAKLNVQDRYTTTPPPRVSAG